MAPRHLGRPKRREPLPKGAHPKCLRATWIAPKGHPGPYQVPKDEEADGATGMEGERLEDVDGRPPIRTQVLGGEKGGHHGGLGSAWGDMGLPRGLLG